MKLTIEKPVTVITPTIGKPELWDAIRSVSKQTYNCKHLLVVDCPPHAFHAFELDKLPNDCGEHEFDTCFLPYNTGANGMYGHRIYASFPHLVNSDYILFLDEDNWYQPNHVETLINHIEQNDLHFAYSLRSIHDKDGTFITTDECESLGRHPIWFTHESPEYHVDTSSYCFRRDFLTHVAHLWNWGWGADRRFYNIVRQSGNFRYDGTGQYTLAYRLDGNPGSVTPDFFKEGNAKQEEIYKGVFPWRKT